MPGPRRRAASTPRRSPRTRPGPLVSLRADGIESRGRPARGLDPLGAGSARSRRWPRSAAAPLGAALSWRPSQRRSLLIEQALCPILVGRETELDALEDALLDAL